jgi:hypothetical protein
MPNVDVVSLGGVPVDGAAGLKVQVVTSASGGATAANQTTEIASLGATSETSAAADNSTSGLNGLLKRLLARITTIFGDITDAAVTAGATGSMSAKLRSISRDLIANIVLAAGTNTIGGTLDAGPSWTSVFGVSAAPFTSANASAAAASVTDAPAGGQKLVITDLVVSVDTAMTVTFTCETTGAVILKLYMAANGVAQITFRGKRKLATADKKLQVQTSVAGNIAVTTGYYSES